MIIFSTFNAQYLHEPLNYLINKFSYEQVEVDYGNIFINLKKSIPPEKAIIILVRFNDLIHCEEESIDIKTLQKNLNKFISQIEDRKKESGRPILVVLCPSLEENLVKEAQLKQQEQIFINQLNQQSIKNISYVNFNYHSEDSIFNSVANQEAHIPYSPEYFVYLAYTIAGKWYDMTRKVPFKVIVVDCDNTLWEGVVDEVGIQGVIFKEHHQRLQHFLVKQVQFGKLICLCSKNEEDVISALFSEREQEMPLKIQHLTAIKANWSRKSDNIRELAKQLNLGLEQFVFIDDSDRELIEVKRNLSVLSIKMPENCLDLERVINNYWVFEQDSTLTQEDMNRTEFYRKEQEFRRNQPQQRESLSEFVKSLNLEIVCREINEQEEEQLARVSQLSERTNQFNLNFSPLNISHLKSYLEEKNNHKIITVSASGGYIGNYGVIAAALFHFRKKILEVDYFFLSCRAFGLGIDYRLTHALAELAERKQINQIQFTFKKTNKNRVATLFIKNLLISTNKNDLIIDLLTENQTITFIFSTQELLQLDIDQLLDQADQLNTITPDEYKEHSAHEKKIDSSYPQDHNNHCLQFILDKTQDFNSFVNLFFTNNRDLLSLRNSDHIISQLVFRVLRDRFTSVADLDLNKSLVYLGLDSIKATELSYYLHQLTRISFSISELLCRKTTIANLKQKILEKTSLTAINPCKLENSDVSFTSWQQERLWNAEQKELLENGTAEFQMLACYEVAQLDIERFRQACRKLITSYDVFGMKFFMDEGALRMAIFDPQARELFFEVKKIESVNLVKKAIEDELKKKSLMKDTPLIKFIIYQVESLSENQYYLLFLVHHAIFDAVSLKTTLDFLGKAYQSYSFDTYFVKPIQYRDYIQYQRSHLTNHLNRTIDYWTQRLANVDTLAELKIDKEKEAQPPNSEKRAKRKTFVSSFKTFSCLKKFAQEQNVTCYGVISALYSILIAQYTYQDEIVLLTASTGRTNPSFYKTIGFFVNLLVQPFTLQGDQSLKSYIRENYQNWLQDKQNEDIPFEKIQEILKNKDIQTIFSVPALIYQNYTPPELILDDQSAQLFFPQHSILFDQRTTCHFGPFTLFVSETEQGFHFLVEYEQACFSETLIEKISSSFLALLDNVVENPNQLLKEITCLSAQQWSEIQSLSQGPIVKYDLEKSLVHKFYEQVLKNPEQIALHFADKKINYAKLDQLSTELARQLSQRNVQKNDKVGLCLSQKFLFPISVLAIWKQGAICVPISNEDTFDRYEHIIQESGLTTLILQDNQPFDSWFNEKANQFQFEILPLNFDKLVEQTELNQTQYSEESLKQLSARQGSFIYFTSGSTGKPKGVILYQYNILRVVDSPNYLAIHSHDKVALASDIAFDAAVFEVFIALLNGATLVVFEKEILLNKNQFDTLLHQTGVSILWLTAGLFHQYALTHPELFRSLTYLLVGGDAIKKQAIERVFNCREGSPHYIINGYGPTENSTFTAVLVMTQASFSKQLPWIPIGRPINNTLAYVIGTFGQPVPLGAVGELVIGGEGLAQGYLNHPDLEQQRFVSYPNLSAVKLYRSGDKVFWSHDDFGREQLCYLERIGEEIKRQGYFVSLEEISHCLKQHPAIAQVVVLNTSLASREQRLVAFYVLKEACEIETPLEDYLMTRLPHYMLPNDYQKVSAIPLTRNGKVDKKQLLSLVSINNTHFNGEQPILNAIEKKVRDLFKKIIILPQDSTDELDIDKSFFLLGGSSIKAVQLIAEIQNRFAIEVNYSVLKEYSSIRKLSNWISQQNTPQAIKNQDDMLLNLGKTDAFIDKNLSIIFIHPAGGTTDCYQDLIAHLPESYNYFGINDPVITKKSKRPDSISEMASIYLENIQQKIKGNFILAGYSFGGMLSLEIAAQAEEKGISTLLGVFLLDTWIVSCTTEPAQKVLRDRVNAYFDQTKQVILNKDYDPQNKEDAPTVQTQQLLKKETERMREQYHHLQDLGFKFIPKRLIKTKINLFKAIKLDDSFKDMNLGKDSENNYLSGFVNNKLFVKILVDGDHYSILNENNSLGIARHFSIQLQKIKTELDLNSKDKSQSLLFRSSKNDDHFLEDNSKDDQQSNTIFRVN